MEQYIPKSVIIAEIKKRIDNCAKQREDMLGIQCYTLADDASARIGELSSFHDFIETLVVKEMDLQNVPISDELEEAAQEYTEKGSKYQEELDAFKAGAKWQKERILDCNTTLQRIFELGKQEMKQQIMAQAVDGTAMPNDDEIWCNLKSFDLKEGDKVKVIVIKQE